jgi:5-methylthioadenosine/S-adenosylhomocysteine deaminase
MVSTWENSSTYPPLFLSLPRGFCRYTSTMPFVPADLCIEVRYIAPMTAKNALLEDHSLVVRDGKILDILPSPRARARYDATVVLQRAAHLLMPGMINAYSDASLLLFRGVHGAAPRDASAPDFARDGILAAIAEMLKAGVTCFSDCGVFPDETAFAAGEQGIRTVVGMPMFEAATPWAQTAAQSLTHSLNLRDKYRGHPLISTVFAPRAGNALSDQALLRLATLADELEAGIMMELHRSGDEVRESIDKFGMRPIERLWKLGLLTPALNAVHMVHATAADIELAQRCGLSISMCPQSGLLSGNGLPPVAELAAAGIRLGLGSAGLGSLGQDVWGELKLIALLAHAAGAGGVTLDACDALNIATRGGAAVLGLEDEVGTLEAGKWADLCCVDLSRPATQPLRDPLTQVVFNGGRDLVSDVWVAGRQLLADGELTRLDWSLVAARSQAWAARLSAGG